MKCPSSRASAARNSLRILVIGHHLKCVRLGRAGKTPSTPDRISGLRLGKAAPIEAAISGARFSRLRPNAMQTGVKMRLIGWAIALAAAGLTPALAQPAPSASQGARPGSVLPCMSRRRAGRCHQAKSLDQPDAAQVGQSYRRDYAGPCTALAARYWLPAGWKQWHPDSQADSNRRRGGELPRQLAASAMRESSASLSSPSSSYAMIRYPPQRQSRRRRAILHNTLIEVIWTLVPGADPGRNTAIPIDPPCPSSIFAARPRDLVVKVTGHRQWYKVL